MITHEDIRGAVESISSYITSSADHGRRDRLWPTHYQVFATNPMSVGYGATGTAAFLARAPGGIPDEARAWMLAQRLDTRDYAPGLLVGLAGIAYAYAELGWVDEAEEAMSAAYRSPLLFADPTAFFGAAGWGMVSLRLHALAGRSVHLERAADAAEYLLKTAVPEGDTLHWVHTLDDDVHHGYGWGSSGIGSFLLEAGVALGRGEWIEAARAALEFDLANRFEDHTGWTWPDKRNGLLALPYFAHGASGVGTAAIRFHARLGDPRYLEAAETIAESTFIRWSVLPSVLDGLSGIGEFMLDMAQATGRTMYAERALAIADSVLWYALDRPGGTAFPGRWLTRVACDYGTGSAGIGTFFDRMLSPGPRFLVDVAAHPLGTRGEESLLVGAAAGPAALPFAGRT
jgi:hypothetical protein